MKIKPAFAICFNALLIFSISTSASADSDESFSMRIRHPAIDKGKEIPFSVHLTRDPDGAPSEYYGDVDSVSCGDGVCEIVRVRLHWDALGGFLRYEVAEGSKLTKKGHSPFSDADYEKLRQILADTDSRLKNFSPESISTPGTAPEDNDVDAVTKPTPLFYQNSVVKGAVYTCYTLWHWVNGDVSKEINAITQKICSHEHLMKYVRQGTERFFLFSTSQLAARKTYDPDTQSAVIERADRDRAAILQGSIVYFENALKEGDPESYYSAMLQFFDKGNSQKRVLCLRSLAEAGVNASPETYDKFARYLPGLQSYFEVHLLFNLLAEKNPGSTTTVSMAEKVLNNSNFLIARRAYWFLEKQKLNSTQAGLVEDFRVKYENRL